MSQLPSYPGPAAGREPGSGREPGRPGSRSVTPPGDMTGWHRLHPLSPVIQAGRLLPALLSIAVLSVVTAGSWKDYVYQVVITAGLVLAGRADDRDLRPAAGSKDPGKARLGDQGEHLVDECHAIGFRPVGGVTRHEAEGGVAAAIGSDLGQRLQQPMHQRATLQRQRAGLD